ncbi:MAG: sigma-70 family RNA polymerase sigma factor [Bryobacter sp.]|nr:sigma-70 family RNA polymerase sigma factor [Bryobacter sp.]
MLWPGVKVGTPIALLLIMSIAAGSVSLSCPLSREDYAKAYDEGYKKTVRFLAANGATPEVAEEVAQAAWVRGWERIGQLRHVEALTFWINSIAKNFLRNSFRRRQTTLDLLENTLVSNPSESNHLDAERILGNCNEEEKHLLQLYYLEGFTSRELSREFGLSPVGVRVRLTRLKKTIVGRMETGDTAYREAA